MAFDIEIARILPDDVTNWKPFRPLGITCAATLCSDGQLNIWYGRTPAGDISNQMNQTEAAKLVEHLQTEVRAGYSILTWNGLGFDFDILAEESGLNSTCGELAMDHVDMMFHIFCLKGYPISLDKAAKGMGLSGKTPGMTGDLAPRYWADGRREEVLEYVAQDVRTTLELAQVVEKRCNLKWTSNRGNPQSLPLPESWLTVKQAMALPEPDTSWMSNPWSRSKFTSWVKG